MKLAAFDIGGTALKMGVVSSEGEMLAKAQLAIDNCSGQQILQGMLQWLTQHPGCQGIAISAPGYIDPQSGFVAMGGSIRDFDQFPLQQWLSDKSGLPVSVENDANCALLAERWLGEAGQLSDFLMMTIGTGIGGAIFCNGALVRGAQNRAGEFGYLLCERPGSDRLSRHSMNQNCTLSVLRRRYAEAQGKNWREVSGEEIFAGYDRGDALSLRLVNLFYQDICTGLYNLCHLFDPQALFIGGGISARPTFMAEVTHHLQGFGLSLPVARAHLGNDAGMIGAVFHFLNRPTGTVA